MSPNRSSLLSYRYRTLGLFATAIALTSLVPNAWGQTMSESVSESASPTQPITFQSTSVDIPTQVVAQTAQSPLAEQVQILTPLVGTVLDAPATTVIVRFPIGANIELRVNDHIVDAALIGRTETDSTTNLVTQSWYGVTLVNGANTLSVTDLETGQILTSADFIVRGAPVELQLSTQGSTLAADGRSTIVVQGQLLDETQNRSNWNTVVSLTTSDGQFIGVDQAPDQLGFQVEVINGTFTAELQSSLESHLVQLKAVTNSLEAFHQIQFVPPNRTSLVTGIVDLRFGARGTDYYSSFRDFLPLDNDNRYELDLDSAIFATGNLGEWLFTGAYNSDRSLNEDCRGNVALLQQAAGSCGGQYPVYGDDSSLDSTAASIDSLYLRLERSSPVEGAGIDYVMWGDFDTQEFTTSSQLFTSISRQLHGFKLNYNLGNLAVTGFYGDNVAGFQRDIIAPDGTSGFYFLSQRPIIQGSEEVFLELEELNRPGTVIERLNLSRGADYDIDYDRGTLLFKDPISQTSVGDFGEILVRRIVTTYQYEGQGTDTNIFAGRLQYNLARGFSHGSWIGASYLRENQGSRSFELYGADAQIQLDSQNQLIAEIAHSSSDFDLSGPISGSAYRLEWNGGFGDWLSGRAYLRSTDAGFTNAATTSFVPGQTRYGLQTNFRVSDDTSIRAQFDHEDNVGTAPRPLTSLSELLTPGATAIPGSRLDNSLTTYSLGLSQRLGNSDLEFDWVHRDRSDRINTEASVSSDQLRTRITTQLTPNLTLRAQNELNLSSSSDPLYPSRTVFGLDWEFMPGINLGINQIYGGSAPITTIDLTGERQLGENTTVRGRFSSIEGQQLGGSLGIEQGFTLAPGLHLDLGYEYTFDTVFGTAAGTQFSQPYAVGSGGSALSLTSGSTYSIGLSYTDNPDLQASIRAEHRTSSQGSNTVIDASVVGRLSPALSILFDYQLASAANQTVTGVGTTSDLKLGLSYRDPNDGRFNAFLRYEHRLNPGTLPTNALFGSRIDTAEHLFSAEALYTPSWRWELYAKYAFRNSTTRIARPADAGGDFISSNSLHLAQLRATYRLGYSWDLTAEARWIGGLGNYNEYGFSVEAGYYPTPDLRVYTGYSAGGANDSDFGVNRSAGGFYVGISAKVNSLFDGFGLQDVAPPQQQEALNNSTAEVSY